MPRVASIILDIPTKALDRPFTYAVDESLALPDECDRLEVGCAVLVPFGGRKAIGFVIELADEPAPDVDVSKLKAIEEVLSPPFFNEVGARCALFMGERYIAPFNSCIRLFTPPGGIPKVRKLGGGWLVTKPATAQVDDRWVVRLPAADEFVPRKSAVKQIAVLDALRSGELRVTDLTAEYGQVSSVLKALEEKGVIRVESRRRYREAEESSDVFRPSPNRPTLTDDQVRALAAIEDARAAHEGRVVVLDGVTGSGKTEVYLNAIEKVLGEGRNAIVLVPEISLTPQTVARFRGRFGDTVAVLHSRMSDGERYDQWDIIRTKRARVVVGARSALFAPLDDVGIIIIDEEHETSYKQDQAPRYVTRDVAAWMAEQHDAVLVLGSATPSIEALYECQANAPRWTRVVMPSRANGKPLPAIEVADMALEFGAGNRHMFSRRLQEALFEVIDAGQKAVLMLNQRGFAQFLLCRECGFVPECENCSTSLTFHERGNVLKCHHCGHTEPVPHPCPECGSVAIKKFGAGTQRVEADLRVLLEGRSCEIVRMDADTTAHKGDHQRLLERFARADAAVLLGTQMIAKGLDFDDVTLVGVINADTMLKLPDFRAEERTFDLIEQVAGRSGRADLPGRVIVQTYSPRDRAVAAAAKYNREKFLEDELKVRKKMGYPPYVRLTNVLFWGGDESRVVEVGKEVYAGLKQALESRFAEGVELYAPTACVLSRLAKVWRYHLLIKIPRDTDITAELLAYFRKRKPTNDVTVSVDIDPISVL